MQLTEAMKQLADLYQDAPAATLDEALALCAHGHVAEPMPGKFMVRDDEDCYNVEGQACDCNPLREPGEDAPPCRHVVAAELSALLQDGTRQHDTGTGPVVPIVERHIERIVTHAGAVMHEAPYSVNLTVEDSEGYNFMFTVRKQDAHQFFEAIQGLRGWVKKQGFRPVVRGYRPAPPVQDETEKAPASTKQEEHKGPSRSENTQPVRRFHAESLYRSETMDGKTLWAVKGPDIPRYNAKFGMRIWPEALEQSGLDYETLQHARTSDFPSLKGYVAEYVMREDTPDKPDKIIRLVKEK